MDPGLAIVLTVLSLVLGMGIAAWVYRRRTLARLRSSESVRAPIRSDAKVALLTVVTIFAVPGIVVPVAVHFHVAAVAVAIAMLVLIVVGLSISLWSPWTVGGEIALDGDTLRHEQKGQETITIDLSQPYRLTEGWGQTRGGIVVGVGVTQGAYVLYFHYPRPLSDAGAIGESNAIGAVGPGVGLGGLVIHERLRARDASE